MFLHPYLFIYNVAKLATSSKHAKNRRCIRTILTKQASMANKAGFISQRSQVRQPMKPYAFLSAQMCLFVSAKI